MRLKNYNEDLVLDTVKIVLKDRTEVKPTRSFILDVAAYALNRIPPKYITSERGFTRELILTTSGDDGEKLIDTIELIALVNHAIDIVGGRRKEGDLSRGMPQVDSAGEESAQITYFYNMPHIFGRIVDAGNGDPVISAQATLFVNDRVALPAEPGWRNPYRTNEQTKGYFSFWPQPESGVEDTLRVELAVGFNHEGYRPFTVRRTLKLQGEFFVHDYIRGDKLLDLGTLSLDPI